MLYRTALLTLALASPAFAQNVTEGQQTLLFNASALCFPALPVYDGNVRKRPLAVVNEGTVPSYVTCGFIADEYAADQFGGVERFDITAKNQSNVVTSVRCVAVVGVDNGGAKYYPQAVALLPGERRKMEWNAAGYGFPNGWEGPVGMSCLLPPLNGLNEGHIHWDYIDRY